VPSYPSVGLVAGRSGQFYPAGTPIPDDVKLPGCTARYRITGVEAAALLCRKLRVQKDSRHRESFLRKESVPKNRKTPHRIETKRFASMRVHGGFDEREVRVLADIVKEAARC
jgi:hypothetical protein